ncbi:MAG: hypothetical protein KDA81_00110 [Planctomycetaceae bacterium]|nr:hypothetical protein [Planctomycetaceae bacterium]
MPRLNRHGNASGPLLVIFGLVCLGLLFYLSLNRNESAPQTSNSPQEISEVSETTSSHGDVPPSATSVMPDVANTPAASAKGPIWETWDKPVLALMLTGEQHGYFEPCGCTSNQLGGMSRRADLFQKLKDAGWAVRGLDAGGLARRSVRQSQIKFETTLTALRDLNYAAIGLGPEELRLQPDFLLSQHLTTGESPLFFLSANLTFFGTPELGTPVPSAVFEEGGLKIGVTSVMSEEMQKEVLPHPDVNWKEPSSALEAVLASFDEQNVDVRILLCQGRVGEDFENETLQLARQFPQFQIVLTANGIGDPDPNAAPRKVGDTLIIESGRKGKYVGVLGVYKSQNGEPSFRYKLVALERDDFNDTPSMVELMQAYQTRLKDEQIVLADAVSAPHPSGSTFVGADKCGECHSKAFDVWKNSAHAHALESLDPSNQREGFERLNGVVREYDPECLACHVNGWDPQEYIRFRSGFLNEEFASTQTEKSLHTLMAGNQCENCHGPGSRHVELIEADNVEEARKLVRVTLEQARQGMCEKCHDSDNSPKFQFDEYWELIKHPGLD